MSSKKNSLKCVVCMLLTVIILLSAMLCASATVQPLARAYMTKTVYFYNAADWDSVYAFYWIQNTGVYVHPWPGIRMTSVDEGIYKCEIPIEYDSIIFNDAAGNQTQDLIIPLDRQLYDYRTEMWIPFDGYESSTEDSTWEQISRVVYCKNSAGWDSVSCYTWKGGVGDYAAWPGEAMIHIGDDVWQYTIRGDFDNVIFNCNGLQTLDLSLPGNGYMYDNLTGEWTLYDTSLLTVMSVSTDIPSPQYKGTRINLLAEAYSPMGEVEYQYTVQKGDKSLRILGYYPNKSVGWTPDEAGVYTLIFEFRDRKGNFNKRVLTYEIKDDTDVKEPYIKDVTPPPNQVLKDHQMWFNIDAGGGNVGTNQLLYKVKVTGPYGNIVNEPSYSQSNTYIFTPTELGFFTVTVYVKASDGVTVQRSYEYECIKQFTPPGGGGYYPPVMPTEPVQPSTPTQEPIKPTQEPIKPTQEPSEPTQEPSEPTQEPSEPTQPSIPQEPAPDVTKGDADNDGEITVVDATLVQRFVAGIVEEINLLNADTDGEEGISIIDATVIQRFVAGIIFW